MDTRFPGRLVIASALITIMTMLFVMIVFYGNHQSALENETKNAQLRELSAQVLIYDQQLTNTALLAAYSGNSHWENRYKQVEQQLIDSIDKTLELADSEKIFDAAKLTEDANNSMILMEIRAFAEVRGGRSENAVGILNSEPYREQKKQYSQGMASMLDLVSEQQVQDHKALQSRLNMAVLVVAASFLLTTLLWFSVYRALKNWRLRFGREQRKRNEAEAEVRALNDDLESRIEERTRQLQDSQDQLVYQANYDELTGLPNRRFVLNHLTNLLSDEDNDADQIGVMLIDLDHFKRVNDTLGHAAGDELLKEASDRLKREVDADDIVSRLGGDEFLIVSNLGEKGELESKEDRVTSGILEGFSKPFVLGGNEYKLPISPSIGVAVYPQDGGDVEEIIRNADTAMYAAKDNGRNNVCRFMPEMVQRNSDRIALESKLRSAVKSRNQFELHYQPQIDLASNEVIGVEALIRWMQPDDGLIPPDQFIPLAEDTGLIIDIGYWVLFEAARQYKEWRDQHSVDLILSVNVASQQLKQGSFLKGVNRILDEHGVPMERFGIEITESSLIGSDVVTQDNIDSLSKLGIKLSLDDFGTGYSALSYLKQYPFDYLKIDRSFIGEMDSIENNAALVEGIINMSRNIDLKVVSEGTETAEQCDMLRSYGCDIAQGYFYSKPLPSKELIDFLMQWNYSLNNLSRKAS